MVRVSGLARVTSRVVVTDAALIRFGLVLTCSCRQMSLVWRNNPDNSNEFSTKDSNDHYLDDYYLLNTVVTSRWRMLCHYHCFHWAIITSYHATHGCLINYLPPNGSPGFKSGCRCRCCCCCREAFLSYLCVVSPSLRSRNFPNVVTWRWSTC